MGVINRNMVMGNLLILQPEQDFRSAVIISDRAQQLRLEAQIVQMIQDIGRGSPDSLVAGKLVNQDLAQSDDRQRPAGILRWAFRFGWC